MRHILSTLVRFFQSDPDPRCQEIRDRLQKLPPFRVNGQPIVTMAQWQAMQHGREPRA